MLSTRIVRQCASSSIPKYIATLFFLVVIIQEDCVEAWKSKHSFRQSQTISPELDRVHSRGSQRKSKWSNWHTNYQNIARMHLYPFKVNLNKASRNNKQNGDPEVINEVILTLPTLNQLVHPASTTGGLGRHGHHRASGNRRWSTVRHQRLYCRAGIGYHLEIQKDGRVVANHTESPEGVLEMFSIDRGIVGIRSRNRQRYLCMNRKGKIHTRKRTHPDCEFQENLEINNYNTYASARYSNRKTRKGYFLAISRTGKVKRGKRVSWMQKSAQWLPKTEV